MPTSSKKDEFSEKFQGGGVHFQSKNLCCKIWTFKQGYLTMKTATFEGFVASLKNLQHNFPKRRGGSKAVWNFSENSSVLEEVGIPYLHCVISINNAYFQSRYLLYSLMSTKCKYWLTVGAGLLDEYLDTGLDGLPIDITWSRGCIPYMVVSSCMSL